MIETLAGYVNILLSYFYIVAGSNYGIAIIMLSAVVNIITFPLTRKQIQSSKKLQDIQPELKKLQEKYKHDKEKYNKVTMEYMKENKVNPLGGCLPLIVQFPIIIAVFHLLREPTLIAQRVEQELGGVFSSKFLFGLDLIQPDPLYILPIMAAAATFFHQRMVLTDPKQKMMLYIFPVMIMVISVSFPSGLVLYWFTNSLFSIGNHFLMKSTDARKKEKDNLKNENQEKIGRSDSEDSQNEQINKNQEKTSSRKMKTQKNQIPKKIKAVDGPKTKKKSVKGKKKGAGKAR